MGESVRLSRTEAINVAVDTIAAAIRRRWHLRPSELRITWQLAPDGHVLLKVEANGAGGVAIHDSDFDATLTEHREEHSALDAERWAESVGERQFIAEMPDDVLAARMRSKVKW